MKRNHLPLILVTAALVGLSHLPVARAAAGDKPAAEAKLSEVEFPISCSAPASGTRRQLRPSLPSPRSNPIARWGIGASR